MQQPGPMSNVKLKKNFNKYFFKFLHSDMAQQLKHRIKKNVSYFSRLKKIIKFQD